MEPRPPAMIACTSRDGVTPACCYYRTVPPVESGREVLVRHRPAFLRGQRVALLAHQASIDRHYEHAAALVGDLRAVKLRSLLAPEHGLWGAPQDHIRVA